MAKSLPKLRLGPDKKENDLHGMPDYPCEVYYTDLTNYKEGLMPDHWHNELEFGFVTAGSIELRCNGKETPITQNQCFFINSNVAHSMKMGGEKACFYSIVFHESFLQMPERLYKKYIHPITKGTYYSVVVMEEEEAIHLLKSALRCYEEKTESYELTFYNYLCGLWNCLYQNHPPVEGAEQIMIKRIQEMLQFISANYMNNIGVEEIAASGGVSKRECFRCFKEKLHSSPNVYLMQYRMNRAAEMVLLTDYNMERIARECGFSSATYFSTKFKTVYGMSPKEYKMRNRTESL